MSERCWHKADLTGMKGRGNDEERGYGPRQIIVEKPRHTLSGEAKESKQRRRARLYIRGW